MNTFKMVRPQNRFMPLAALWLAASAHGAEPKKVRNYEPCGIRLGRLSQTGGAPGDTFKMYGQWGKSQGAKLPHINHGSSNRLEVLFWSEDAITARVPQGLKPGSYKVGVYCNSLALGGSYSSGWMDFTVTPAPGERLLPESEEFVALNDKEAPAERSEAAGELNGLLKRLFGPGGAWKYVCAALGLLFLYFIRRNTVVENTMVTPQKPPLRLGPEKSQLDKREAQHISDRLKRLKQKKEWEGKR